VEAAARPTGPRRRAVLDRHRPRRAPGPTLRRLLAPPLAAARRLSVLRLRQAAMDGRRAARQALFVGGGAPQPDARVRYRDALRGGAGRARRGPRRTHGGKSGRRRAGCAEGWPGAGSGVYTLGGRNGEAGELETGWDVRW